MDNESVPIPSIVALFLGVKSSVRTQVYLFFKLFTDGKLLLLYVLDKIFTASAQIDGLMEILASTFSRLVTETGLPYRSSSEMDLF